ncbi:hypothetical protein RUM44_002075 [Polyplax serrata]|uniref:Uncharacterized protein n=1 Tax=Polyplax serrata TaxID=468196 RepID=A0ABR1ALV3_POLSC
MTIKMMQPLLRHQIYKPEKGRTFTREDEDSEMTEVDQNDKETRNGSECDEPDDENDGHAAQKVDANQMADANAVEKPDIRLEKNSDQDVEEEQDNASDSSELLNVDEESNQSGENAKTSNVSPVDLTSRSLEFDRNRFKFNTLFLRNRTLFNNCPEFRDHSVNFFGGAKFQLKEDKDENGRVAAGLDKDFGTVADRFRERFMKIEDIRQLKSEKLFLNGKAKDVAEERPESVGSNLSPSPNQDANGSLSHFRRDERLRYKGNESKSHGYLTFQRFEYSPDRKSSSSPVSGESGQPGPRRNLAFSVENILDPNKFTGNSPTKLVGDGSNLAALVAGQRLPGPLGNMVAPVGCCWRPHLQDGGESDRDDNSETELNVTRRREVD